MPDSKQAKIRRALLAQVGHKARAVVPRPHAAEGWVCTCVMEKCLGITDGREEA